MLFMLYYHMPQLQVMWYKTLSHPPKINTLTTTSMEQQHLCTCGVEGELRVLSPFLSFYLISVFFFLFYEEGATKIVIQIDTIVMIITNVPKMMMQIIRPS